MTGLSLALAVAWPVTLALVFLTRTPPVSRARLDDLAPAGSGDSHRAGEGAASPATGPLTALGHVLRQAGRRPNDAVADRRLGLAVLAAALVLPLAPVLAFPPLAWAGVAPAITRRRDARAHESAVVDQLPDLVDLLSLTTDAGLPVSAAVSAIAGRPGGPLGAAVARAAGHVARGGTTADALAAFAEQAGPAVRPLVDALAEHDRYGTALRPALVRAGIEGRLRRRRQAEEAARRLPVTLLFPLVLTTLPAFFLLAIVPLLAGSLGSLSP
jgi:tight adherence protein C